MTAASTHLGGVAMYTHVGAWVETIDDALRVAKAANRRNVGTIFHLHHFQATRSKDLHATLRRARPYLMCVIIQGTDSGHATHKILGEGSFDMVPLVRTLHGMGYRGPIGTMGYTQRGDIPGKLKRAYEAWERIKRSASLAAVTPRAPDCLRLVAAYADAMIAKGRPRLRQAALAAVCRGPRPQDDADAGRPGPAKGGVHRPQGMGHPLPRPHDRGGEPAALPEPLPGAPAPWRRSPAGSATPRRRTGR